MAFADPGGGRYVHNNGSCGNRPAGLTLTEACEIGDLLDKDGALALATTGTATPAAVVALAAGAIGDVVPVSKDPVIKGVTGATAGNSIYLAEGTSDGKYTETAPSTTGDVNTIIGWSLDANTIQFDLHSRADSVA